MNKSLMKKIAIILIAIVIITIFYIFDLDRFLTLSYIKNSQENFKALLSEHTLFVIACYMGIYILVTSISLPGATVLTLAGGALFGLWVGTIIVSISSAIGATIACFFSRFLLRDWVNARFGDRVKTIDEGIKNEGAFYLFSLRLIPVFPFFVINLVLGLTKMSLFKFAWVSQLGMLLGTIVYVNAGKEIAKIDSLSGILSLNLIFSFILLVASPIVIKKFINICKSKEKN